MTTAIVQLTPEMHRRVMSGAANYIAANKSDPFCAARVAAHIRMGISGYHWFQHERVASHYDAQMRPLVKTHTDGTEYVVTEYHSLKRP